MNSNLDYYTKLRTIRRFEETVLTNFAKGVFFGTTHTYLGQEANAVGVLNHLSTNDIVFSNHRCHGHFIAYGGDMRELFAEMMGKVSGVCAGRGGSQHLQWRNFYSNGVQGGIVPVATGMAFAEKHQKNDVLVVCFLGDGTLGQGVIYESLNMASLWQAPILYVIENNQIAQTTPTSRALAGEIAARFSAFDIPVEELDSSDVLEISACAERSLSNIRAQGGPQALILNTHRFGPHSKGDDTRDPQWIAQIQENRDPLKIQAQRISPAERQTVDIEVESLVINAYQQALDDPFS